MARRGRPAAPWVPPTTETLLDGRTITDVCIKAGINPATIRQIFLGDPRQVQVIVEFLKALGVPETELTFNVLLDMTDKTRQNKLQPCSIVPGSIPKPTKTNQQDTSIATSSTTGVIGSPSGKSCILLNVLSAA